MGRLINLSTKKQYCYLNNNYSQASSNRILKTTQNINWTQLEFFELTSTDIKKKLR